MKLSVIFVNSFSEIKNVLTQVVELAGLHRNRRESRVEAFTGTGNGGLTHLYIQNMFLCIFVTGCGV